MERERKVTVPGPEGKQIPGVDIEIDESVEKWSELKLVDGARIRLKQVASQVIRLENVWDNDGNPVYIVKSTPMIAVSFAPDHLKKNNGR